MYLGKGIFVLFQNEVNELVLTQEEKQLLVPYIDGTEMSRYKLAKEISHMEFIDRDKGYILNHRR